MLLSFGYSSLKVVPCVLGWAVALTTGPAEHAIADEPDKGVKVTLSVFSGQQDPQWWITEGEDCERLVRLVRTLKTSKQRLFEYDRWNRLGYASFRIQFKGIDGLPEALHVWRDQGVVTSGCQAEERYTTAAGDIYALLVAQAEKKDLGEFFVAYHKHLAERETAVSTSDKREQAFTITLAVYSGRPNPQWRLVERSDQRKLTQLIKALESKPERLFDYDQWNRLGYASFWIVPQDVKDLPEAIHVWRDMAYIVEGRGAKAQHALGADAIYDLLVDQAEKRGHDAFFVNYHKAKGDRKPGD